MKLNKLFLIILPLIFSSCAPEQSAINRKPSSFTINLPQKNEIKKRSSKNMQTGGFLTPQISTVDEIDCYAAIISWGSASGCFSQGTKVLSANLVYGAVTPGSQIVVENVPSGNSRTIQIIGFRSDISCPNFTELTFADYQQITKPLIIASKTVNLVPGNQIVELTLDMANSTEFDTCNGTPFNWQLGALFDIDKFDQSLFAP